MKLVFTVHSVIYYKNWLISVEQERRMIYGKLIELKLARANGSVAKH